MSETTVAHLRQEVIDPLKQRFVGRDEVIDLIGLAVVAGEHLFLHGPPGTAKSALIRQFAQAVQGRYFEYMLTRFSEPNEIFGPIDIARLREGKVVSVTTGMLPEAEFVFLDELFNANSAILNNLLTVLNERVYRRGVEIHRLPLLSLFSASNHLPDDDALQALFDRFLLRCHVASLKREAMPRLLAAGWALERSTVAQSTIAAADLAKLAAQGRALSQLFGPLLARNSLWLSDAGISPPAAFLVLPLSARPAEAAMLILANDMVYYLEPPNSASRERVIGWTPALPRGSTLVHPVLSWLMTGSSGLELAGIGSQGHVHWSRLAFRNTFEVTTRTTSGQDRYLAVTILREAAIAAVTARGVDWLRVVGREIVQEGSTEISLPSAIACFPHYRGHELIVVGSDGTVARLPWDFSGSRKP